MASAPGRKRRAPVKLSRQVTNSSSPSLPSTSSMAKASPVRKTVRASTHASPSEPQAHATVQRLRRLQEITALLNSSLKPAEIRTQAIEAATIVMEAEAGSLLLLDDATGELYFEVAHGAKG